MRLLILICLLIVCCAGGTLLGGCAATTQIAPVKAERYFWPPLPDTPRIEFIGAYTGTDSFKKKEGFMDLLLGEEAGGVMLDAPVYVTADGLGKVYVVDQRSRGVYLFDLKARTAALFGGEGSSSILTRGTGIAVDGNGNVYVGDSQFQKIFVLDKTGKVTAVWDASKYVKSIAGIEVDKSRKRLVLADVGGHRIVLFGLDGSYIDSVGKRGQGDGEFNFPTAVAVDREGNIIVSDSLNSRVQRFSSDLKFINKFGKRGDGLGEMGVIKGVAVDSEGHIYVTDGKMNKIMIFNDQGDCLLQFGGRYVAGPGISIGPGGFQTPQGIYVDQNDTVYVADQLNSRFQVYQYMNEKYVRENPY
ncbi:SBBP repeat-containing protein [Geobacter pelophilus]|uniref:SBBP repeat-containing protein n=1 Tax=Geoanaerobacter pelophilus TaxID=60036 RepID=A0AAW4L0U0_9BACT|nr:6-bladed beta-propeller [Geoanaerobacter pelophilus]MBT0663420.1 SBBP repeat-containing protein [Geoanaerobacter pelophilus]